MKKLLLFIALLPLATAGVAQFTQDDFPREADFTEIIVISGNTFDPPTHGTDQLWDYSDAQVEEQFERVYMDAAGNPDFPGALNFRERDQIFQDFIIESDEYEAVNENAYTVMGRTITDVEYPITSITGGANDLLRFVGGSYLYAGNYDYLVFPFDYGDTWQMTYETMMPFELTVAGFGLNSTPGQQVGYFTEIREVVGQGAFIIPDESGEPSSPIPGYYIRSVRTVIDSIFIGGSPAPQMLMDAFGLVQGAMDVDSFYVAYAPGLGSPLLGYFMGGPLDGLVDFRPSAAALGQGPTSVDDFAEVAIELYPNPAAAGQMLNVRADYSEPVGAVQLYSLSGQKVYEAVLNQNLRSGATMVMPRSLKAGMYFVQVRNTAGEIIGQRKVVIH